MRKFSLKTSVRRLLMMTFSVNNNNSFSVNDNDFFSVNDDDLLSVNNNNLFYYLFIFSSQFSLM